VSDPDEALRVLREALAVFERSGVSEEECNDATVALAEGFEALDGWLTGGGYLPDAWNYPFGSRQPRNRDRISQPSATDGAS
jgi:hypothetical protein